MKVLVGCDCKTSRNIMEPWFEALAATCPLSPPVPVAWPRPEYLAEYAHTHRRKLMEHPMDFEVRKRMSRIYSLDSG